MLRIEEEPKRRPDSFRLFLQLKTKRKHRKKKFFDLTNRCHRLNVEIRRFSWRFADASRLIFLFLEEKSVLFLNFSRLIFESILLNFSSSLRVVEPEKKMLKIGEHVLRLTSDNF